MRLDHVGPVIASAQRVWCQQCFRSADTSSALAQVSCALDDADVLTGRGPRWCATCGRVVDSGRIDIPMHCTPCLEA
ncbi:MAG: hypothetical protein QG597_4010 [Actinomycetota bacterium]|jgi:predicted Zn-ribbon and HTH transcriptional regulator|nr:hypothetical protein [Actinomycetota bacterium]